MTTPATHPLVLLRRFPAAIAGVSVALVVFALLGPIFSAFPALIDTDSSYHVALGRLFAEHGVVDELPWTRLSVFFDDFGDKELLFHLLIAPFTGGADPTAGAKLLLAALVSSLLGATTTIAWRWMGAWSLLVPLLQLASLDLLARLVRLRPELLGLLILLAAVAAMSRDRFRLVGIFGILYSLSYTAFHVLPGLCGLVFLHRALVHGRRDWPLVVWPTLGSLAGLILHPAFPKNLVVWKIQNIDFFRMKGQLDVGAEIGPPSIAELITGSGLWLTALVLLVAFRPGADHAAVDSEERETWTLAAGVFLVLWLAMARMSIYAIPFLTIAVFARLPGARHRPLTKAWHRGLVAALILTLGVGVFRSGDRLLDLVRARGPLDRVEDWRALSAALPPGARVAAEWGSTALYMLWAPQATYLNVLDPIFMAIRYPEAHRVERAVFEGREPDLAVALRRDLSSDWIALSLFHQPNTVIHRLEEDPRFSRRYAGYSMLWALDPRGTRNLVRDWIVVERWQTKSPSERDRTQEPYPLLSAPDLREIDGFVDLDRIIPRDGCARMVHRPWNTAATAGQWTLRSTAPGTLWIGRSRIEHVGDDRPITLVAEEPVETIAVEVCSNPTAYRSGFLLIRPDAEGGVPSPATDPQPDGVS